ncbi:MAG: hypothetical protein KAJ42_17950 [Gemmatimonadetes bacterium]|nr:hypothetical protein [Gemmatimonadota bacterium]
MDSSRAPLPERLFETDVPLILTLEADFHQLRDDREQESEERPGRVFLEGETGEISFPVRIRTRGRFRLNDYICSFPPVRLDFPSDSLGGSVLEGLDKVKLVTHCRNQDTYEQNVLEEYLAYRVYEILTEVGFRVQLALITYRDISGEEDEVSRLAFLIEDEDALAERLGGEILEVEQANPDHFVPRQAGLMYLFQYLIGNTDWSIARAHNMKFLRIGREHYPIPFDFDFSGFVDTPYAGPSPVVARYITKVRDRRFWGVCSDEIEYPALFSHFNERREAILELIRNQPGLKDRNVQLATSYVESFYDIINNGRDADFMIVNGCRQMRQ